MSVHKKLQEARIKLQGIQLKKSGRNKFAEYDYFELGDFLPAVQNIFSELGLCGVVSFGADIAQLTITDIETDKSIVITSPMSEANLKGCHPIQNLGAVETYTRRYLWVTAMEIVEHDALDATTGTERGTPEVNAEVVYKKLNTAAGRGSVALNKAIKTTPPEQISALSDEQKKALRAAAHLIDEELAARLIAEELAVQA